MFFDLHNRLQPQQQTLVAMTLWSLWKSVIPNFGTPQILPHRLPSLEKRTPSMNDVTCSEQRYWFTMQSLLTLGSNLLYARLNAT